MQQLKPANLLINSNLYVTEKKYKWNDFQGLHWPTSPFFGKQNQIYNLMPATHLNVGREAKKDGKAYRVNRWRLPGGLYNQQVKWWRVRVSGRGVKGASTKGKDGSQLTTLYQTLSENCRSVRKISVFLDFSPFGKDQGWKLLLDVHGLGALVWHRMRHCDQRSHVSSKTTLENHRRSTQTNVASRNVIFKLDYTRKKPYISFAQE